MNSNEPACRKSRAELWLWAGLWSSLFTGLVVKLFDSQRCFRILHGNYFIWFLGSVTWALVFIFFLLSNRMRLVFTTALVAVYLCIPQIDSLPQAEAEARVLEELRTLAKALSSVRARDSALKFPATLPTQPSDYLSQRYRISYKTFASATDRLAEQFLIEATPLWRECGLVRSFTVSQDGIVYFTIENRPATRADAALE